MSDSLPKPLPRPRNEIHIRARSAPWWGGVGLCAHRRDEKGELLVASLAWEPFSEGLECPVLHTLRLEGAQVLMDDLWHAGVRPTEGAGSAGAMRAAESHITDLRTVAFKLLGVTP